MLPTETPVRIMSDVGAVMSRYTFKPDLHSSHALILRWLGEGRGRRLLDVGAGDGLLGRRLSERGWRVTGIERDPDAAAAGARYCERMIVVDLDRDVPDPGGRFEVVVYGDVLEHLADPGRVLVVLGRALADGGEVIVSVPNVAHLWMRLSLLAGRFDYAERGILDGGHLRFFTERSLRALVASAGFTVMRATATPAPLAAVLPPRWHGRGLAAVQALNAAAARAVPRLLGYQFVVRARRG
jgi:2-polyprenyl-3-methyl-5-hydroxy-6-metoxy-1,4-benzoquinol methylase